MVHLVIAILAVLLIMVAVLVQAWIETRPSKLRQSVVASFAAKPTYVIRFALTLSDFRLSWIDRSGGPLGRFRVGTLKLGRTPRTPSETPNLDTALDLFVAHVTGENGRA